MLTAWKKDSCNERFRVRDDKNVQYHLFPLSSPLTGETNGCRNHNAVQRYCEVNLMVLSKLNWNVKLFFSHWKLTGMKGFYCDLETINPTPNQRSEVMEVMQFIMYISTSLISVTDLSF